MATAFSYSGTGLESAIATGSGGLSSTATSVEVDAIPSDLSAGDTVKVAIGTATNFANGNGETVHGDIGTIGGGANGGTDITGLSRGQEGTTASSFSEGDPVRVGVQGRDDAGPERAAVQSQIYGSNPRLEVFDDFARTDRAIAGDTAPSGQTWSVEGSPATANIVNNRLALEPNSSLVFLRAPVTMGRNLRIETRITSAGDSSSWGGGLLLGYQDSSNYVRGSIRGVSPDTEVAVSYTDSGSTSEKDTATVSSFDTIHAQPVEANLANEGSFNVNLRMSAFGGNASTGDSNVKNISVNEAGLFVASSSIKLYFEYIAIIDVG